MDQESGNDISNFYAFRSGFICWQAGQFDERVSRRPVSQDRTGCGQEEIPE
jgi:hypothetical protein